MSDTPEPRLRPCDRALLAPARTLDETLNADHVVRFLAEYVDQIDLSAFLAPIKAMRGSPGRNANDPQVLLLLWMYATLEGIGSARQIERLSREHDVYRWILGGMTINYHALSDFRNRHAAALDQLMIDHLAALLHTGAVEMKDVAQDGMKIRASAGSSSFRRAATLEEHVEQVTQQIAVLKQQTEDDPGAATRQQQAARMRAAVEKKQRLQAAQEVAREVQQKREERDRLHPSEAEERKKKPEEKTAARASSTDPDCRKMQMSDGGTRPAFNVQFSTDVESKIMVGIAVTNQGNDSGLLEPMLSQIETNLHQLPQNTLNDGSYITKGDIDAAAAKNVEVYGPIKDEKKQLAAGKDPYQAKPRDSEPMKAFRQRMGTEEAKALYRKRGETAELVNAGMRNRGMYQVRVRGLAKVRTVMVMQVIVHNLRETRRRCEEKQNGWNWTEILRAVGRKAR